MSRDTKEIAHDVVAEVAPEELELFDQLWAEYEADPALLTAEADITERQLGAGVELSMTSLTTLVLLPIIVDVAKNLVSRGVNEIIHHVKHRLGDHGARGRRQIRLSDEQIDRIARTVATRLAGDQE